MTEANETAFPLDALNIPKNYRGLTKREYFAAKVIQGLLPFNVQAMSIGLIDVRAMANSAVR